MDKVVVIEGNRRDSKRVLDEIKDSLAGCELCVFDGKDHYNYVSQMISEISCFGENRLFIIKELPQITINSKDRSKKKARDNKKAQERTKVLNSFKKLFPLIPEGNVVVFYDAGLASESFFKEVRKHGKVRIFDVKCKKKDAKKLVVNYFKKRKIELHDDAAILFVDSLNPNGNEIEIDRMVLLLQKMYNYAYGQKSILKKDIYPVCSSSKEFVIWTLYGMLDKKDYCSAIGLVEDYLGKMRYFEQETILLISGMAWRYGLLLMAKKGVEKGISIEEIKRNILNINKLDRTGKAQKIILQPRIKNDKFVPQYSEKMIRSVVEKRYGKLVAGCYTLDDLLLIFYVLMKAQIKIRFGCTDAEVKMAIRIIVLTICGEITKKNTIDGILEHRKMLYGIWDN